MEIDENFTTWRIRHASMAHRMIGMKIGTGGTSGVEYLQKAAKENMAFRDLWNLSTFVIPQSALPRLPDELSNKMQFHHDVLENLRKQRSRAATDVSSNSGSPINSPILSKEGRMTGVSEDRAEG